ncbi:hypothetical protein DPEC_G00174150 [Dallia pectoralis]|uniref:Uncharacterized protein n=1 Tax=Dallia pectoralis TaxID=75939 RepID=A0ACC2GE13_DALPE|nr:hypothetical protein DPEC_G00174150 [Dallia pectoralis]
MSADINITDPERNELSPWGFPERANLRPPGRLQTAPRSPASRRDLRAVRTHKRVRLLPCLLYIVNVKDEPLTQLHARSAPRIGHLGAVDSQYETHLQRGFYGRIERLSSCQGCKSRRTGKCSRPHPCSMALAT